MCSRSFGKIVTDKSELLEAAASYTARAGKKLRSQHSHTGGMMVFLKTNRFRVKDRQYRGSRTYTFPCPTADIRALIQAARRGMNALYKPGFNYHKCGVMLLDIGSADQSQLNLFHAVNYEQEDKMMQLMDGLNKKIGCNIVFFGAQGTKRAWRLRSERRSNRYTTKWDELLRVRC